MSESSYNGNSLIKASGVPVAFTAEQIQEWIKCKDDPVYFIENYIKIVTLDHGLQPMRLYDFQKEIVNAIVFSNRLVSACGRQLGKCVEKSTIYKVRNKKTGQVLELTAEEFHEINKPKKLSLLS
jgi:hypothetical protein